MKRIIFLVFLGTFNIAYSQTTLNDNSKVVGTGTGSDWSSRLRFEDNASNLFGGIGRYTSTVNDLYVLGASGVGIRFAPNNSTAMYINTSANVGIGTISPEYKLDVSGTLKTSSYVGVGGNPDANVRLRVYQGTQTYGIYNSTSFTDYSTTLPLRFTNKFISTSSATRYAISASFLNYPLVAVSTTNSGYAKGIQLETLRNYDAGYDDSGALTNLYGQTIIYGHYDSNTSSTPITTSAFGMVITPYIKKGTITNMYDIYIAPDVTGGTATNRWGFYQNNSAKNYFGGSIGVGTTTPTVKLDIVGTNTGVKTTYGFVKLAHTDAQLDIISANDGAWGSTINLVEGASGVNNNVWSIARKTSSYANGLFFNFGTLNEHTNPTKVCFLSDGKVGIGTTNPQSLLAVNGTITTKEVNVTIDGWSDFVFKPNYKLRNLVEVEQFIKTNNHLPDVPSEKEVKEKGVSLGEMNAKLLQKIEELTLYLIEQNKKIENLEKQVKELNNKK